jgi:hypothetical protein
MRRLARKRHQCAFYYNFREVTVTLGLIKRPVPAVANTLADEHYKKIVAAVYSCWRQGLSLKTTVDSIRSSILAMCLLIYWNTFK